MASHTNLAVQPIGAYVGSSGWAYNSWKPDFYPSNLSSKKFLEYYATQLNSVEVNYTFRALPGESILNTWLAATGDGFRFSFKAPQRITHLSRLKNCRDSLDAFVRSIAGIQEAHRLGLILFQLPPNMKADPERLSEFLDQASSTRMRMAFEFRHESWFAKPIYSLLEKHSVALCAAESDELSTPDVQTAPFFCYRLRKSTYSEDNLDTIREKLRERARAGDVFAYFKHEEEPTGALHAAAVLKGLKQEGREQA